MGAGVTWEDAVQQAIAYYREHGYDVTLETNSKEDHVRFDLLAMRDDEVVAVEIRPRAAPDKRQLARLRDAAAARGWGFHLFRPAVEEQRRAPELPPEPGRPDDAAAIAVESLDAARGLLSEAGPSAFGPSLLLACRSLEAWLRVMATSHELDDASDWRATLGQLVSLGRVSRADYPLFKAAFRERDRFVHGYGTPSELPAEKLPELIDRIGSLIGA